MKRGALAYAQARLQARYGARTPEPVWQQLQTVGELGAFLEQARATGLRFWVVNISAGSDAHEIERLLRDRLRDAIGEVARWLPDSWRAALRWTTTLVDLPVLVYLLRGERFLDWMREEDAFRALAAVDSAERRPPLAAGRFAPILAALGPDMTLRDAWFGAWRRTWPHACVRLEALARRVAAHADSFGRIPARAAWREREGLRHDLEREFRRAFLDPAAAFAWLLLLALEAERLRGELLARTLFPPAGAVAASREAA